MQRLYVGRSDKIYAQFPAAPAGPVTVDVLRHDGTVLASDAATVDEGTNLRSFTVPLAGVNRVDELRAAFTDVTTTEISVTVDVAAAPYFEITDVYNPVVTSSTFTAREVYGARLAVEAQIDSNVDTSFVGRYVFERVVAVPNRPINLKSPYVLDLLSVKTSGVAQDLDDYFLDGHFLQHPFSSYTTLEIEYVEGVASACPADLASAGVEACRSKLLRSRRTGVPPQATSISSDVGTFQIAVAGLRRPFGIPEVDAVVLRYAEDLGSLMA